MWQLHKDAVLHAMELLIMVFILGGILIMKLHITRFEKLAGRILILAFGLILLRLYLLSFGD